METLHDPVFGYSDIMRFSWAPSKNQLGTNENAVKIVFRADLDDDDAELEQQKGMANFLQKKRKRLQFFEKRNMKVRNSLL